MSQIAVKSAAYIQEDGFLADDANGGSTLKAKTGTTLKANSCKAPKANGRTT
jgi:hypothetical protein